MLLRPAAAAAVVVVAAAASMAEALSATSPGRSLLPKLVVLDLDATLWLPELYTLRGRPDNWMPQLGRDVKLFDDIRDLLATTDVQLAVASRTNRGAWARNLLTQLRLEGGLEGGATTLEDRCASIQIFPGDKQQHFHRLRKVARYDEMIFFDDALDGRYGNCERVAELGVLACHTPFGLTRERWDAAFSAFADGRRGEVVRFCQQQQRRGGNKEEGPPPPPTEMKTMKCVSLAMPFAALVLNGRKTIETRRSPIFRAVQGETVAVRVGQKDWTDDAWKTWHDDDGAARLPKNVRRGDIAGLVDVGATRPLEDLAAELDWPDVERMATARRTNCGAFATALSNPRWLPRGIRTRGNPGIYSAQVPADLLEQ